MRLQKYLSLCGFSSRREAEGLIKQGKIKVNQQVISQMGVQIEVGKDTVEAYGKQIVPPEKKIYLLLDKPANYLTTKKDPWQRPTVYQLLPKQYQHLFPVGRLDNDSEGLLLFTNDGDFTEKFLHPRYYHEKEYLVRYQSKIKSAFVDQLLKGIILEEGKAIADKVAIVDEYQLLIVLHQGFKRQIKRMAECCGYRVVGIKRVRLGKFPISKMKGHHWQLITKEDII
ncbi:MAG: pseudouridine synthase [Candidatus Komeilibacteria bacterium CG_4_10_14_0_2_um_filter_37_10]|uniref:Pseudouridine synthase n=1 Tax=Candidatus Komeilibacteria bacterium CG_4_10_14_0_2_um_filter_37_10 TaxID=1974470 RepID=A0A2M7VF96_9BACT|nr:MAG: pseudouridine synthase [Candidatus Komeilibacteria bacterium CG_4_10_14_0_2_um_filter_37_10]